MATIIFLLAKCFPGQVFGPRPKAKVSLDSRSILNSSGLLNTEGSRLAAAIPNKIREFDSLWSSSLADSLTRGKPDNQSVDYSTRITGLNEIMDVTTKPIIFDGDNGGEMHHIPYLIKTLERLGASAIAIEDKIGVKQNSLFADQSPSRQDNIKSFCKKIRLMASLEYLKLQKFCSERIQKLKLLNTELNID